MMMQTGMRADFTEKQPIEDFTEKAYLQYAMYVIMDRALPLIGDGLKPVQRRIVYAMSELGLKATAKYKKSARTVGDVLGKFHPHGDTACYEAMVIMAQPFTTRYPLVDGQGNWGSSDDAKSFAAMRYTEAKLSKYAETLLSEIGQGTVDWTKNFDGTLDEPAVLPARLPNILLNGTTGIAVGMATDIPPHNLNEVVNACVYLLDNPDASIEEICEHIKGPDYPTAAEIITPKEELIGIYKSGQGTVKMRATYFMEDGDIVINHLPHQASGSKILEQIDVQRQAKKLPMVADIRDESDHEEPIRLVIEPRSNRVDIDALMKHLFATTDLEKTFRVNLNVIGLDRRPRVKDLKTILDEWLIFRSETVRKRLSYRLNQVKERLHILEGFLIAYLNIDEVIAIIRHSDDPKPELIKAFGLSDIQAEAILNMRLRHLAKLEEIKIRGEQDELAKERDWLEKVLGSEARLKNLIKKELTADAKVYGDARRSPIVVRESAQAIKKEDLVPTEPVTVILSEHGWVRSAKGHDIDLEKINFRSGDRLKAVAYGKSNMQAVFLDSTGRSYSLAAHSFPSARTQGEPLSGRLSPPPGAKFFDVMMGPEIEKYLFASSAGYGFITTLAEMVTNYKQGKAFLTLPGDSSPMKPIRIGRVNANINLIAISNEGRMLIFPVDQIPELTRGKGNKIIHFKSDKERLEHLMILRQDQGLKLFVGKRHYVPVLDEYIGTRGRRGRFLPKGFRKISNIEIFRTESDEQVGEEDDKGQKELF